MRYEGYTGQIQLEDDGIVVIREGTLARQTFGKDVGPRRIPFEAISHVHLKPATRLVNGYISFGLGGAEAKQSSGVTAASDPDVVMFRFKGQTIFSQLHDMLQARIAQNAEAGIDPATVAFDRGYRKNEAAPIESAPVATGQVDTSSAPAPAPMRPADKKLAKAQAQGLRQDIAEASVRMAHKLGGGREIRKLAEHLHEGETVMHMGQGTYEGKQGIVAMTSERLLFVYHGIMGQRVEDFPLDRLSSVQSKSGVITGDLTVHASGNSAVIKQIIKPDLKILAEALRRRIASGPAPAAAAPAAAPAPVDIADQLAKFAALRDQGILTDEEFTAQKAKLLS